MWHIHHKLITAVAKQKGSDLVIQKQKIKINQSRNIEAPYDKMSHRL